MLGLCATSARKPGTVLKPGLQIDDAWSSNGPSEIDTGCVIDTGLSASDVQDMIGAWRSNSQAVQAFAIDKGALMWQNFYNGGTLAGPPFTQGNSISCNNFFRKVACVPNSTLEKVPLLYGIERNHDYPPFRYIVSFKESLAAFLLARGPFAWFGYSWLSCIGDFGRGGKGMPPLNYTFPPALKVDYGVPQGHCEETGAGTGVFVREWSKAKVELDCNSWTSTIAMKTDDMPPRRVMAWLGVEDTSMWLQAMLVPVVATLVGQVSGIHTFDVARHCDVTAFGAVGDNATDNTEHFRAATSECGTVIVPAGTFRTASFNLTSHQRLSFADGATLVAQPDARLYPIVLGLPPMGTAGRAKVAPCALISAYFATNVTITGAGRGKSVVDGLGWQWWQNYSWKGHHYSMISLIQTYKCADVTVANLTLQNSPTWTLHPFGSDGVHIHALSVLGQRAIGGVSGIHPDSSRAPAHCQFELATQAVGSGLPQSRILS